MTTIYSTEKVTFIDFFEMVQDTKDFCMLFITFEKDCIKIYIDDNAY